MATLSLQMTRNNRSVKEYFEFAKAGNYSEKFTRTGLVRQGLVLHYAWTSCNDRYLTTAPNLDYVLHLFLLLTEKPSFLCIKLGICDGSKAPLKLRPTLIDFARSERFEKMSTSENWPASCNKESLMMKS